MSTSPEPEKAVDADELECQRLMRRWRVTAQVARGMIAIKKLGDQSTTPVEDIDDGSPTTAA